LPVSSSTHSPRSVCIEIFLIAHMNQFLKGVKNDPLQLNTTLLPVIAIE
jgi:hypothetical protein